MCSWVKGDGSFQTPVGYSTAGAQAEWVTIGDLNGDGKPDLVVAEQCQSTTVCSTGGGVSVLLGNGDGTFQPATGYFTGGSLANAVAIADVNGDKHPDLIVDNGCEGAGSGCTNPGLVGVLLGNGDGTFQPAVAFSADNQGSNSLAVGDLDGDGHPDVVVMGSDSDLGPLSVFLGNGDGTFSGPVNYPSGGFSPNAMTIGDVNGDGHPDLVVANYCQSATHCTTGSVSVLQGNGDGTFQASVSYGAGVYFPASLAIGDVNGDGKADLVVGGCGPSTATCEVYIGVLLGNGDGSFQPAQIFAAGTGEPSFGVAVADLNGDGKPDVVLNEYLSGMAILLNNSGASQKTTTTLTSSLNPSTYGQTVTFTAALHAASGVPGGTVALYDGSSVLGTATLVNGRAIFLLSSLVQGTRSLTAIYEGSLSFGSSASPILKQNVNLAATSTTLTASVNPVRPYQIVSYTATVTSLFGGAVTGGVSFNGYPIALSGNHAIFKFAYGDVGTFPMTAVYGGDQSNSGSSSAPWQEKVGFPTTTRVNTSASPSFAGQPVTFSATISTGTGTVSDGELVTFSENNVPIGTGTTASGVAKLTTSSLAARKQIVKATYGGDTTFNGSFATVTQTVEKYTTTTALTAQPNPAIYGQAITYTVRVTSSGPAVPTGQVQVTGLGSVPLIAGVATVTKAGEPVGSHSVVGVYLGDSDYSTSKSPVLAEVINGAATTTGLTSSANPSPAGQSVTLTATVTSSTGLSPNGSVVFTLGTKKIGTVALSNGTASVSTAALPVGSDTVTATYVGVTSFKSSAASLVQVVGPKAFAASF